MTKAIPRESPGGPILNMRCSIAQGEINSIALGEPPEHLVPGFPVPFRYRMSRMPVPLGSVRVAGAAR
jgi:hypothetical protein